MAERIDSIDRSSTINGTASIVASTKTLNFQDNAIIKNNDDSSPTEKIKNVNKENICRDFLRGVCKRGNDCKFFHPQDTVHSKSSNPPACRDYQNGMCMRKSCKYAHIVKSSDNSFEVNDPLIKRKRDIDCGNNYDINIVSNSQCNDYPNQYHKYSSQYCSSPTYSNNYSSPLSITQIINECGDVETLAMKISYLQRQVIELRSMNELLIDQNSRLKTQLMITQENINSPINTAVCMASSNNYRPYSNAAYTFHQSNNNSNYMKTYDHVACPSMHKNTSNTQTNSKSYHKETLQK